MAKIEYLKNAPGAVRGSVRTVDSRSAKALVGLGYARYYEAKVVKPRSNAPARQDQDDTAGESAPEKREYKRRDLKAEK